MQNVVPDSIGPSGSAASRSLERRRAAYADEVQRLVGAGFAVIREQESLEPRVSEIVSRAGLSNQAFYRHFRSKDELLLAVLCDGVGQLHGYLAHRMEGAADPLDAVRRFVAGICAQGLNDDAVLATRPFALARGRLMDLFPDEVAEAEERLTALLRDAITVAREVGALPGADPALDARTVYDLSIGWLQQRLGQRRRVEPAEAEHLVAFALRGLQRR